MAEFESLDGDDGWDEEFAGDLIGCTLLVGITYVDHDGELLRRQQVFGRVGSADSRSGIVIREEAGSEVTIAPVLEAIEPAAPGIYRLADQNASIENPNFTALLTVQAPLRS